MKCLGLEIRFPASETPPGFQKHDFWTIFGLEKGKSANFQPWTMKTIPVGPAGFVEGAGDVRNPVWTCKRWLHPGFTTIYQL